MSYPDNAARLSVGQNLSIAFKQAVEAHYPNLTYLQVLEKWNRKQSIPISCVRFLGEALNLDNIHYEMNVVYDYNFACGMIIHMYEEYIHETHGGIDAQTNPDREETDDSRI